jgi:hypothetical protein
LKLSRSIAAPNRLRLRRLIVTSTTYSLLEEEDVELSELLLVVAKALLSDISVELLLEDVTFSRLEELDSELDSVDEELDA